MAMNDGCVGWSQQATQPTSKRQQKIGNGRGLRSFPESELNNNNNRRLVTLAEYTSDDGKQTNSSTKERGSMASKLLGAKAKS